jgi:hypothetical protein
MPNNERGTLQIRADILQRLRDESESRGLSMARVAELAIMRGLPQLPPVPSEVDEN